ncbi:hypothetical protein [Crateriforma spongiae]|uniref:hypothetical protein n=1 Tax=Crateriforma spongiae TaxID=2724528 RepID=UPI0014471C0D|nr:hypothetical protein [Crateriforma spongiae]
MLLSICIATLGGCRSRAKQDLYVQKLTSEVRLLEDQLYQADYENQVLAEKLKRERERRERTRSTANAESRSTYRNPPTELAQPRTTTPRVESTDSPPEPIADQRPNADPVPDAIEPADTAIPPADSPKADATNRVLPPVGDDSGMPDLDDLDDPSAWIDEGEVIPPGVGDLETNGAPNELPAPADDTGTPDIGEAMPPSEPEPPGKFDLQIPPIEPGEILPPPTPGTPAEDPPGKVPLPDSLKELGVRSDASPIKLSLHRGFSGPHQFGDEDHPADQPANGMLLTVTATDLSDRPLDLAEFDIDAKLNVVAIDPTESDELSVLAKWEFDPAEVRGLVSRVPVSGLRIPVMWDDVPPSVSEVVIQATLATNDDKLSCEGVVRLDKPAGANGWMPRGDDVQRVKTAMADESDADADSANSTIR